MTLTITSNTANIWDDIGFIIFAVACITVWGKLVALHMRGWFIWGMFSVSAFLTSYGTYSTSPIKSFAWMVWGFLVFLFFAIPCYKEKK